MVSERERPMTLADCRPAVQAMALLMEKALQDNEHKGGWDNRPLNLIMMDFQILREHLDKSVGLQLTRRAAPGSDAAQVTGHLAVHAANNLMFMADRCGLLGINDES